jgi:hypothetical protein
MKQINNIYVYMNIKIYEESHMKKIILLTIAFIMITTVFSYEIGTAKITKVNDSETNIVTKLVKSFGGKLQNFSLLAPNDIVKKELQKNYEKLITPQLLSKWSANPLTAPGRLTSSPWPDRIEIKAVIKLSGNEYEVKGEIIEITSVEKVNGGYAEKRPITLRIKKIKNNWLISDVYLGAYERQSTIEYKNTQYGFNFSLPLSWSNYKIIVDRWEGLSVGSSQGEQVIETGLKLLIRHPQWTQEKPRQDIPIMIFTLSQWNKLEKDESHIGAAPIGPSELGRNNLYVFALPARYNFAFPTGYEEVENILKNKPFKPINKYN